MSVKNTKTQNRGLWVAGLLAGVVPGIAMAGPTVNFGEQGSVTFNYALQMWAQQEDYTSSNDDGDQTDFYLRRNRLTFNGQFNDYVGFYAQLEGGTDSKDGEDDSSVFYRDAYITLDYSDPVRLIAGRFKNTFSRENLEACLEPLTLDRSAMSYTPFAGSRDTGFALWGNLADGSFQYRLMLADGREGDEVASDSPRITARVHWSGLDPEYDYGYRGTYLGTQKVLTVGLAYDSQADVAYNDYTLRTDPKDYTAVTADVFFEYPTSSGVYTVSGAAFDYEVLGDDDASDPDPALPASSELEGQYVKLGYMLPNKVGIGRLQFFARYDTADYNRDDGLMDHITTAGGFNYYIDGQRLKVTGEFRSIDYDNEEHATDPSLQDYTQATLGLQLIF
jgi:phosphate-selective porin